MQKDIEKKTDEVLQFAKTTACEAMLLEGLLMHDSEYESGQEKINATVRLFKHCKIKAGQDLHKALWKFAQLMVRNQPFQD